MNDDIRGITFLYFDSGHVQDLAGNKDIDYQYEFCVHMDSQDVDKLKSALNNEVNENTTFSPQEMEFIRNLADNTLPECKPDTMTDQEWEIFLDKLT